MKQKILFLDIDGTILLPDDSIQDSTKEAIKQVKEKGIEVFLATGRPLHEIMDIGEELRIQSFIGYNGAYAIHQGQDVFSEPMDSKMIQFFIDTAEENDHELIMYTNSKNVYTGMDSANTKTFIEHFHLKHNVHYESMYIADILGVTVINLGVNDVDLYEQYSGIHLSPVNIDGFRDHAFDVIQEKVNKGFAVQTILDLLKFNKEEAIAFGDGINDKEMLQLVGESFAMGNAHPDLFTYAKHKTTAVTDSGIYNGLKSLGLLE
ncbi:HAD family hydrolase [Bacillus suaedae]